MTFRSFSMKKMMKVHVLMIMLVLPTLTFAQFEFLLGKKFDTDYLRDDYFEDYSSYTLTEIKITEYYDEAIQDTTWYTAAIYIGPDGQQYSNIVVQPRDGIIYGQMFTAPASEKPQMIQKIFSMGMKYYKVVDNTYTRVYGVPRGFKPRSVSEIVMGYMYMDEDDQTFVFDFEITVLESVPRRYSTPSQMLRANYKSIDQHPDFVKN